MPELSLDLRRRIVEAYADGRSGTYETTAQLFGVGRATVSRLLRRKRESGDVEHKPRGGNNPRRVDLGWLRVHAQTHPHARLIDRIEDWHRQSGVRVGLRAMWTALRALGWTHKKRHLWRASESAPTSKRNVVRSSSSKRGSTRRA